MLKDEGRNPTGVLQGSGQFGRCRPCPASAVSDTIACASTGNAATSLAGHAALAGIAAVIFVPQTAPEPKLAQLLVYGATVVCGRRAPTTRPTSLCSAACERFGWYNRNCAINPVLVEGKKTAGLEIAEQSQRLGRRPRLGRRQCRRWLHDRRDREGPGRNARARGHRSTATIAGSAGGRSRSHRLCAATRSVATGLAGSTLADSINVPVPRNWRKAVRAIHDSAGKVINVSDEQILAAMRLAGRHGVFAEPAAAAALAGVVRRGE